jgi:undecaprenyl-diphosphatase
MTDSPAILLAAGGPKTRPRGRVLAPARYRHPGDVIRLIAAALVLAVAVVIAMLLPALLRPAAAVTGVGPVTAAGQVLTGLVQVMIAAAALVLLAAALRYRRFRVLATVAGGFAAAAALTAGITYLAGPGGPVPAGLRQGSWLAGAGFPDPAVLAGLAAVAAVAAPWLSRPWRRASWVTLLLIGVARLIAGGLLPLQLVLALAAGVTVGAGLLVAFGVPDRRMGPEGVAAALRAGGVPVSQVTGPLRAAKGSRPFEATTGDGNGLFVKVFGSDQRDADLLYRAWRGIRLRGVGDTRPAASLFKAVEHEALLTVMAERAGVAVPHVGQVIKAEDGSVLLTMDLVAGTSLDEVPADRITDQLARTLWREVGRLHQARIAHRSLHGSNIMISHDGCPRLVDFSFAELAATSRQRAIDVAELLTSLAGRIGPDRAVATAAAAIGASGVATAMPLLQPLALSAGTRREIKGQDGLLKNTRAAAIEASGDDADKDLVRLQRVRPRTLLAIAAVAGAFYFLLPQIADVSSSWHALQHVNWAWLPVIIGLSALTYVASAMALIGAVPGHVPFGPAVLTQGASSFINRVSPANVGGMALNARFLQKSGTSTPASVAAVGVNALAGAVMHVVLIVVFFALAGHDLTKAFQAAVRQQDPARPGGDHRGHRSSPGDTPRPPLDPQAADPRRPCRGGQPAAGRRQPGQAGPAVRRLGPDHPGLHRRAGHLGPGVRRGPWPGRARRGVPGRRGAGDGSPHARRPRRDRGGAGRRADRRRHATRARGLGRAAVPAGHLLAAGTTRLAVLAVPAAPGIRVTVGPRPAQRAPARVPVVPAGRRRLSGGAPPAEAGPRLRARAEQPFLLDQHGT